MANDNFEQRLVNLQQALLGFALKLTRDKEDAKDLLQETSLKALSHQHMYDGSGCLKSWLYTIMRNIFLNRCSRESRITFFPSEFQIPGVESTPYANSIDSFSSFDLLRVMNLLSTDNQHIFGLYLYGYSYEEIARRTGMKLGTVKVRIYRIKRYLNRHKDKLV